MKFYNVLFLISLLFALACCSDSSTKKQTTNTKVTTKSPQKKVGNAKPSNLNKSSNFLLNNMVGKYEWLCCNKKNNGIIDITNKINSNTYSGTMFNSRYPNKISKVELKIGNNIVINRNYGEQIMTIPLDSNSGKIKINNYESEFILTKK